MICDDAPRAQLFLLKGSSGGRSARNRTRSGCTRLMISKGGVEVTAGASGGLLSCSPQGAVEVKGLGFWG